MNGGLAEALLALGVDAPEHPCANLDDDAISGVVRWGQDQARRGQPASSSTIVHKLKNGGLKGYGAAVGPAKEWWRTWKGREAWLERNVPDLDPIYAETAVISLTQQKREPTEELVREFALLAQKQQEAYDAECRKAVKAQTYHALKERENLGDRREGEAG